MTIIRAMLYGLAVSKQVQATLQATGPAVTKKWFVKINLSW